MWVLTLVGCLSATLPPRNCATRVAFYPDADGDGLGEPTDVYYGCEAPPGWTTALAPADTGDTAALPTGDTAAPPTGETGGVTHTGAGGSGAGS